MIFNHQSNKLKYRGNYFNTKPPEPEKTKKKPKYFQKQ